VERRLVDFDGRNLAGWLYTITERQVRDARRRAWFRNIYKRPREVVLEYVVAGDRTPEEHLQTHQDRARFYRLVAKMNSKWRESFVLCEVEGYDGEEIAALRGIPAATVRTHIHRARKEFIMLRSCAR
jgi:RNA polymerase sigma factor (sigma-70 family)